LKEINYTSVEWVLQNKKEGFSSEFLKFSQESIEKRIDALTLILDARRDFMTRLPLVDEEGRLAQKLVFQGIDQMPSSYKDQIVTDVRNIFNYISISLPSFQEVKQM
jgi:hypothetical protein